jgi:hypothetical protein
MGDIWCESATVEYTVYLCCGSETFPFGPASGSGFESGLIRIRPKFQNFDRIILLSSKPIKWKVHMQTTCPVRLFDFLWRTWLAIFFLEKRSRLLITAPSSYWVVPIKTQNDKLLRRIMKTISCWSKILSRYAEQGGNQCDKCTSDTSEV